MRVSYRVSYRVMVMVRVRGDQNKCPRESRFLAAGSRLAGACRVRVRVRVKGGLGLRVRV